MIIDNPRMNQRLILDLLDWNVPRRTGVWLNSECDCPTDFCSRGKSAFAQPMSRDSMQLLGCTARAPARHLAATISQNRVPCAKKL